MDNAWARQAEAAVGEVLEKDEMRLAYCKDGDIALPGRTVTCSAIVLSDRALYGTNQSTGVLVRLPFEAVRGAHWSELAADRDVGPEKRVLEIFFWNGQRALVSVLGDLGHNLGEGFILKANYVTLATLRDTGSDGTALLLTLRVVKQGSGHALIARATNGAKLTQAQKIASAPARRRLYNAFDIPVPPKVLQGE